MNKKKGKKNKKEYKKKLDDNILSIIYFFISILIILSLYTKLLSNFGNIISFIIKGQFAKLSIFLPILLLWNAFLHFYQKDKTTRNKNYIIQTLLGVFVLFLYGSFSFGIIFPDEFTFELLKSVFVESIVGNNIGIWSYILTFFCSKIIGKFGMFVIAISILFFIIFKYTKVSLYNIIDNMKKISVSTINLFKLVYRRKEGYKKSNSSDKKVSISSKIDDIHHLDKKNNKFDFLERYKKEISEFTEFRNFEENNKTEYVEFDTEKDNFISEDTDLLFVEKNTDEIPSIDSRIKEYEYDTYDNDNNSNSNFENINLGNEHANDSIDNTKIYKNFTNKIKDTMDAITNVNNISGKEKVELDNIFDFREIRKNDLIEKEKVENLGYTENISIDNQEKSYKLPDSSLLKKYILKDKDGAKTNRDIEKLESTLKIFGVEAKVVNVAIGPTITRFELQPKMGVKVSKILNLSDDLSLALAAVAPIRIEAPIPGTSLIGIEVPNPATDIVGFREMIDSNEFLNSKNKLPVTLGKDVSGKVIIEDISKMPHLLVAGSTGSGKSVCVNTLICSILFKSKPEDVKMIMIDPKMVELSVYNDIPHLLVPVVTDMKKAPYALSWAVTEMNNRYKLLAENRVRDIEGYNEIHKNEKLPRIIVIVDELADLMMVSPNEVEDSIIRLAQKARACGIHLIIATQRPSVDVITGLIKANIPTRIAFAVSSQVDSRTILDQVGAEKLIGKGDMLYYHPSLSKPHRIQGPFVSDGEVNAIVDFISKQNITSNIEMRDIDIIDEAIKTANEFQKNEDKDELLDSVIEFVSDLKEVSTSLIQRRFRIGYNRASRIIDELESMNIISESNGAKARKVLIKNNVE